MYCRLCLNTALARGACTVAAWTTRRSTVTLAGRTTSWKSYGPRVNHLARIGARSARLRPDSPNLRRSSTDARVERDSAAASASLRQRRCSSSAGSRRRAGRHCAYASDATGRQRVGFCARPGRVSGATSERSRNRVRLWPISRSSVRRGCYRVGAARSRCGREVTAAIAAGPRVLVGQHRRRVRGCAPAR